MSSNRCHYIMYSMGKENVYGETWQVFKRILNLEMENVRLVVADRVTVLLASLSFCMISVIITLFIMLFLSIGILLMLSCIVPMYWACLIVGLIYVGLYFLIVVFRRVMIVNPISRFITRLLIGKPENGLGDEDNK